MLSGLELSTYREVRDEVFALTGGEAVGGETKEHGLVHACQASRPTG